MGVHISDGSEIPLHLDEEQLKLLHKALQKYKDAKEVMSIYEEDCPVEEEKQRLMREVAEFKKAEREVVKLKKAEREVVKLKKAERERIAKEERDRDECEAREDWGLF